MVHGYPSHHSLPVIYAFDLFKLGWRRFSYHNTRFYRFPQPRIHCSGVRSDEVLSLTPQLLQVQAVRYLLKLNPPVALQIFTRSNFNSAWDWLRYVLS